MSKLHSAAAEKVPPRDMLLQMSTGWWVSQAIYVAAKLGIADLLTEGPRNSDELARLTETDTPSLYRVMRLLVSVGLFDEDDIGRFALTPVSQYLRSGVPGSMRAWVLMLGQEWFWRPWGEIVYSVKTGEPAFDYVYGMGTFEHFAGNAEAAKVFNEAMTSLSAAENAAVVASYDFSRLGTVIDVAGGHGSLITLILKANAGLKGVLLDRPAVIEGAKHRIEADGLAARCDLVAGDFFKSVPGGGDVYLLKHIVHDWDEERAVAILKNCRRAMGDKSTILVVETVIPPGTAPFFGKLLDVNMLVRTGGRERTAAEYQSLFASAGLRLTNVVPTETAVSLVDGVRV